MTTTEQAGNDPRKLAEAALGLAAAASKGPWKEYKDAVHPTLEWGDSVNADHMICAEFSGPQWRLNQRFVVASRQLVPDLANALLAALDRIDELEKELAGSMKIVFLPKYNSDFYIPQDEG